MLISILSLIEKWKSILDKKGFSGAVLMDLSKTFDTINHELLIAKLDAYGPLLYNIYLNDLFFLLGDIDICNFVDDAAPNVCDMELRVVLDKLEKCSELAIAWFKSNYMKNANFLFAVIVLNNFGLR